MPAVRIVAAVLSLALSGVPLASPEHVHEIEDHGHVELVVHRHLQNHAPAIEHHDAAVWDHPDEPVATLDQDYTVPYGVRMAAPAVVELLVVGAPQTPIHVGHRDFVERLIHGPPRAPTHPRGPPASSLL